MVQTYFTRAQRRLLNDILLPPLTSRKEVQMLSCFSLPLPTSTMVPLGRGHAEVAHTIISRAFRLVVKSELSCAHTSPYDTWNCFDKIAPSRLQENVMMG